MDIPVREWLWPNITTFIATLLTLAFMWVLFKRYLFKPTREFLIKRQKHIEKQIKDANNNMEASKKELDKAQKEFNNAQKKSQDYLDNAMSKATLQADKMVLKAKDEIKSLKDSSTKALKQAEKAAFKNLKDTVASLSVKTAEKILQEKVDDSKLDEYVDDMFEGLKKDK